MPSLAIDASTPAAKHGSQTVPALVSNSFSPPAGSQIWVFWGANDDPNSGQPAAPTITDSLGTHLTWNQTDWSRAADTSNIGNGQAAIWWANCPSAQTNMTVTVTNGSQANSGEDAHLAPVVFTGADTTQNGAHGKGGGTSQTGTATYTATRAGSWGFLVFGDWAASSSHPTVQSGCTEDSWTTLATQSTGWVIRRTTADGVSGNNVTVGASAPTVEGRYAYVEVLPAVTATGANSTTLTVPGIRRPAPAGSSLILGSTAVSRDFQQPAGVTGAPPRAPGGIGSAAILSSRAPSADCQPAARIATPTPRPPATGSALVLGSRSAPPPLTDTPPPALVVGAVRPPGPAGAAVVLASEAPSLDAQPAPLVAGPGLRLAGAGATAVVGLAPPVISTDAPADVQPKPLLASPTIPPVRSGSALTFGSVTNPPPDTPPAALVALVQRWPSRAGATVLSRGPTPPFVAPAGTPTTALLAAPIFTPRLAAAPVLVYAGAPCDCTTHRPDTGTVTRPNTGTVAYGGSTVTRPDTGIVTRPDTGIVEDPCC